MPVISAATGGASNSFEGEARELIRIADAQGAVFCDELRSRRRPIEVARRIFEANSAPTGV
jgi:hypothetical protein